MLGFVPQSNLRGSKSDKIKEQYYPNYSMNIRTQNKINKRLSLSEIHQYYPNQWVLVIEPQLDDNLNIIDGEVAYHTFDKEDLYNHLHLSGECSSALEYTGDDIEVGLLI